MHCDYRWRLPQPGRPTASSGMPASPVQLVHCVLPRRGCTDMGGEPSAGFRAGMPGSSVAPAHCDVAGRQAALASRSRRRRFIRLSRHARYAARRICRRCHLRRACAIGNLPDLRRPLHACRPQGSGAACCCRCTCCRWPRARRPIARRSSMRTWAQQQSTLRLAPRSPGTHATCRNLALAADRLPIKS